ncbi:glycosyltransferase, partial [Candidatus Dojkabacteria bacterium]|nr:glycosyltransferase [Candidatus Dojkabacteria bacterium]
LMALDSLMSGTPVYGYETTATPELLGTLAPKYLVSKSRLKLLVKNIEQYLFQTNPDEVELIRRQTAKDARTVFSWHKTGKRMFSYCAMDK